MDTVVIGGGAAGCYAAVFSARKGENVILIEPNGRIGKKLAITGKGRCNLTNNCDLQTLIKNTVRNPSFLYSAFARFGTADCMAFAQEIGVPLKTERGGRVFPVSDRAWDVVNALERELKRLNVKFVWERALEIMTENGAVTAVRTNKQLIPAGKVILATGGLSYKATGSTGDGYKMAEKLGHSVTRLKPSLIPLETKEDCSSAAGLTVKNATLTLTDNETGKKLFSQLGEMSFESYGIGGPLTLSASSYIEEVTAGRYTVSLDLKPALDMKKLDLRLQREISENGKLPLEQLMRKLLPQSLIKTVLQQAQADPLKKAAELSSKERKSVAAALKDLRFEITAFRPMNEAIITDGGVSTDEINSADMQSKIVKNLHFAGEIIDVCALTGGFNLQIAYSTAKAAALGKNKN